MIEKIDDGDFFSLSKEERIQVINEGVELLLTNCSMLSKKKGKNLTKIINESLYNIELHKIIEEEKENYELCYFYDELIWGVQSKLEEIKKTN